MPGEIDQSMPGASAPEPQLQPGQRPPPSAEDKAHAAGLLKRIDQALARPQVKEAHRKFERNRKLLRGKDPEDGDKPMRTNLHFSNLAMVRPQVYAKDPEFSVTPTPAVQPEKLEAVTAFTKVAEAVLSQELVKRCKLKKRAKRMLTSAYTTAIGWLKLAWQENKRTDPLIVNQIKDTQDNLQHLEQVRRSLDDPQAGADMDAKLAELRQTLAGLQTQAEVVVARGLVLDFVLSEDVIVLDASVLEIADYERSSALAHRIWMTHDQYEQTFGYKCAKGKGYADQMGLRVQQEGGDKANELLCVYEVWDQATNRVFHVCDGEEGYCRPPHSPDWTGERWYPFFALIWNEIDNTLYPLSDIELTEQVVREYNKNRDDFVRDREDTLPFTVYRKGGSLTDEDVKNIRNRRGNDMIGVDGVGNNPISNDLQPITLGNIDPQNYTTDPARSDMEQLIGGGDAARGTVMKAKTATEAEIMAQGLRGRSAERQDIVEDLFSEMGTYALQVCLRKMSPQEAARVAGEQALQSWPQLSTDQVFEMVAVQVRGGSTGRPDRLQEQDRWTKLQPVIEKTVMTVSELYAKGQVRLGQALVQMLRETLRRFDERIDIEQYLPEPPEDGKPNPDMLEQELQQLKAQAQAMAEELQKAQDQVEKGYVQAAAQIATAADPLTAAAAFGQAIQALQVMEKSPAGPPDSGALEPDTGQLPPQPLAAELP